MTSVKNMCKGGRCFSALRRTTGRKNKQRGRNKRKGRTWICTAESFLAYHDDFDVGIHFSWAVEVIDPYEVVSYLWFNESEKVANVSDALLE